MHRNRIVNRNKKKGTGLQVGSMPLQFLALVFSLFVAVESWAASVWDGQQISESCQNELHYPSQPVSSSCLLEWMQPFLSTVVGTQQESEGQVTHLENSPCNHSARAAVCSFPISRSLFFFFFTVFCGWIHSWVHFGHYEWVPGWTCLDLRRQKGWGDSLVSSIYHALTCLQISGKKKSSLRGKITPLTFH